MASLGVLLLVVIFVVALSLPSVVWAQQNDAASAISVAQVKLAQSYDAARIAESAGANISSLTHVLNDAGTLLSNAELAYSSGDSSLASSLASQSQSGLANFLSDADKLKSEAVAGSNQQTLVLVASIVGSFAVVGAGAMAWVMLKRRYQS